MNKLGYVYSCRNRNWFLNSVSLAGVRNFSPIEEYKKCSTKDLNYAFDLATTTLTGLRQSRLKHFRYIEYDDEKNGSHQRLHSWVDVSGKVLGCSEAPAYHIAPADLFWERF